MQLDQCWRENNYVPYSTSKSVYRDVPVPDHFINFISYTQFQTNSLKNNIFILLNKQFILSCVIFKVFSFRKSGATYLKEYVRIGALYCQQAIRPLKN
jgi:hypothetical protein